MPRKVAVSSVDVDACAARIVQTYRSATADELVHGTEWYVAAHRLAEELSPGNIPLGAAVLAILSPRRSWPQNVSLARHAFTEAASGRVDWHDFPTTGDQRRKLARLFTGEDPDTVVGGPKVRSFWQTIADPYRGTDAVIDRHAMAVAEGRVFADSELRINRPTYADYVRAYAIASAIIGQAAAIVQAVTWVAWRRNNAQAFYGDL